MLEGITEKCKLLLLHILHWVYIGLYQAVGKRFGGSMFGFQWFGMG